MVCNIVVGGAEIPISHLGIVFRTGAPSPFLLRPAISPLKRIVAIICNALHWNRRLRNGFRVVFNVHLVMALKPSIKYSRNNRPCTRTQPFLFS